MRIRGLSRSVLPVLATLSVLLSVPAWAAPPVPAVWVRRHVQFFYQSFTTRFTCDGLRNQIENMLLRLGARDVHVREIGCAGIGPQSSPGVDATLQVLVPAAAGQPHVAAAWRKVVLISGRASLEQAGDCDLAAQFRRKVLPVFPARDIVLRASCVPHVIDIGTYLSADVLFPVPPAHQGR
jgi:hypothetical protein